jgi:hypothetical protein
MYITRRTAREASCLPTAELAICDPVDNFLQSVGTLSTSFIDIHTIDLFTRHIPFNSLPTRHEDETSQKWVIIFQRASTRCEAATGMHPCMLSNSTLYRNIISTNQRFYLEIVWGLAKEVKQLYKKRVYLMSIYF